MAKEKERAKKAPAGRSEGAQRHQELSSLGVMAWDVWSQRACRCCVRAGGSASKAVAAGKAGGDYASRRRELLQARMKARTMSSTAPVKKE